MVPAGKKVKHLSSVNHSAKSIHHHRRMCHTVIIFKCNHFCILSLQIGKIEFLSTGKAHKMGIEGKLSKQLCQMGKVDYLKQEFLKNLVNLADL